MESGVLWLKTMPSDLAASTKACSSDEGRGGGDTTVVDHFGEATMERNTPGDEAL